MLTVMQSTFNNFGSIAANVYLNLFFSAASSCDGDKVSQNAILKIIADNLVPIVLRREGNLHYDTQNNGDGVNRTFMAAGMSAKTLSHQDVIETSEKASPKFTTLVKGVIEQL